VIAPAKYNWLYTLLIVLGVLNFVAYVAIASKYGDAGFGYARDGQFFLGRKGGQYIEVSETIFVLSQIHAASLWITHPAAITVAILRGRSKP
jgi:hypothetical protein